MRGMDEQQLALDCLRLAQGAPFSSNGGYQQAIGSGTGSIRTVYTTDEVVKRAAAYLAFATGAVDDGADAKLALVREALS